MRTDSRLSRMLHLLLHMARDDQCMMSEQIAAMLGTNAAVVRRTMAGLRKAGMARSERGHNGGWHLCCDLQQVTLLDVHRAVGGPHIFAIGADRDHPDCAVEQVANQALADVDGVFACGDMARAAGSVPLAVGDGAMAGVGAHRSLMFG